MPKTTVSLHIFRPGDKPDSCTTCGIQHLHSLHFHTFVTGYSKALCVCGYPPDSDNHIQVVENTEEAMDRSRREAVDLENRVHDSNVILSFKSWINSQAKGSISIVELNKVLELYAFAVRKGSPKATPSS